eukprot:786915-Prorocentrum_minimum.AAC.2
MQRDATRCNVTKLHVDASLFFAHLPELLGEPGAERLGVEHGLRGGERLGDDHHQRGLRAQTLQRGGHVHGVHVGQEPQPPALRGGQRGTLARVRRGRGEGRVDEERPQEAAADADRHHVLSGSTQEGGSEGVRVRRGSG